MGQELWIVMRLIGAAILGGIVGYERETSGKRAGLRTHMLVAIGAALFVSFNDLAVRAARHAAADQLPSTVQIQASLLAPVQAIATGIGFLGAGTIFVGGRRNRVHGLTTAASIWVVAAIGTAVGFDAWLAAFAATGLVFIVLHLIVELEPRFGHHDEPVEPPPARPAGSGGG